MVSILIDELYKKIKTNKEKFIDEVSKVVGDIYNFGNFISNRFKFTFFGFLKQFMDKDFGKRLDFDKVILTLEEFLVKENTKKILRIVLLI